MSGAHAGGDEGVVLTRALLEADGLREIVRAQDPGATVRGDPELRASIERTLARRPDAGSDVWVFGYGSLVWNPCLRLVEQRVGRIYGFHRDLCLRETDGRGSPQRPALTLGLAPGGSCRGIGFRLPPAGLHHELLLLWRREMVTDVYRPAWVGLHTRAGRVPAITFVVERAHPAYVGRLPAPEAARVVRTGSGALGRCADYVRSTLEQLADHGIRDRRLEHIASLADTASPHRPEDR